MAILRKYDTSYLHRCCCFIILANALSLLNAASFTHQGYSNTESIYITDGKTTVFQATGHSSYSQASRESSVVMRTSGSMQQSPTTALNQKPSTSSSKRTNVRSTSFSEKQDSSFKTYSELQNVSFSSTLKTQSLRSSSNWTQKTLRATRTSTKIDIRPTGTLEQQILSPTSILKEQTLRYSTSMELQNGGNRVINKTTINRETEVPSSAIFTSGPITTQALRTTESVQHASRTSNTRGNITAANTLSGTNYDSMSINIQPSHYVEIQDSSTFNSTNSRLQVGSVIRTMRPLSNINSSQIQSSSSVGNKKHPAQSSHFTTRPVFNVVKKTQMTTSSVFVRSRAIMHKSDVFISTPRTSFVLSAYALFALTSLTPSLSHTANITSTALIKASSLEYATSINMDMATAVLSNSMISTISSTEVITNSSIVLRKTASSINRSVQAASVMGTQTSVISTHITHKRSMSLGQSSDFKSHSATHVTSFPASSIPVTATTITPFLREKHLIFLLSAILENETFHQDLADHNTQNFVLLAERLRSELQIRINASTGFVKTEVLNFTRHGNAVMFMSEIFFNISSNVTADSLRTHIKNNNRIGYSMSNISVKEFCSVASCNGRGTCKQISTTISCSCDVGYEGFRCQKAYPVDGNYTHWSSYQSCSKSCNEGTQFRTRTCTNPPPTNGGKNCSMLGPEKQIKKCNLKSCVNDDWIIWLIVAAVCFIVLFALILGCCFVRKAKYYYRSYGMTPDGRSYNLRKQGYTNQAYEAQSSDFRTESAVVPLKVLKEDPFKDTYGNADIVSSEQPRNGSANDVYQRELKSFLANTHQLRVKEDDGECMEPEVNYQSNRSMTDKDDVPGASK